MERDLWVVVHSASDEKSVLLLFFLNQLLDLPFSVVEEVSSMALICLRGNL